MKIVRNGIEYDLTYAEMREVYEKMKLEYIKEDIAGKADEMEFKLSDDDMNIVVNRVDKGLSNNDSYMESYWMTIEYALKEQMEG